MLIQNINLRDHKNVHVVYYSGFPWRHESSLCFGIGDPRFFPRVAPTTISYRFVKLTIIKYFIIRNKCDLLFIHLLKRAWKSRRMEWNIFRKSSLNFTFGQDGSLKSDFARSNSSKLVLLKIYQDWRSYLITIFWDISAVAIT